MSRLRKKWRLWLTEREAAMIAYGIAPSRACLLASKEALGRQNRAQIIGDKAALRAQLTWRDEPDGTTRFYLIVDPKDIPEERRSAAMAFLRSQLPPTRH